MRVSPATLELGSNRGELVFCFSLGFPSWELRLAKLLCNRDVTIGLHFVTEKTSTTLWSDLARRLITINHCTHSQTSIPGDVGS